MTDSERNLIAFAITVLGIIDRDEHWSADTVDEISNAAHWQELSDCDEQGIYHFHTEVTVTE